MKHDPDNPRWTKKDFARAKPASELLGRDVASALVNKGGRPRKAESERKQQVTMRLSPDVLAAARGSGPGWQRRVDDALRREFLDDGILQEAKEPARGKSMFARVREATKASGSVRANASISRDSKLGRMLSGKRGSDASKKRA